MSTPDGKQEFGVAMGIKRGSCQESGCNCSRYKAVEDDEEGGGNCVNCGHFPGNHENLGANTAEEGKVFYADSDPLGLLSEENTVNNETISQLEDVCEWSIGGNELKFLEKLGSGRSANVYKGLYKDVIVAIKVLKESLEPKELENFKGELDIMSKVQSSHVVHFYGGCLRPKICLVMEYCPNGSLFHLLQRKEFMINWAMFFRLATEMAKGVQSLHVMKPPVVHRDLKSLNLLVNSDYQVKVCDFGLSRYLRLSADDFTLHKMRGTYAYSAPEVYHGEKYSTKSDVYSIAVILWEITSRVVTGEYQRPFKEFKVDFQIAIASAKKGRRPDIPVKTPSSLNLLITKCWDAKPENRPSVDGILEAIQSIESEYRSSPGQWDSILDPSYDPSLANNIQINIPSPEPQVNPAINNQPRNNNNENPPPSSQPPVEQSNEHKERLNASGKRRPSFSRSASKIFQRTKTISDSIDKEKSNNDQIKITIEGQPQWQHRTAEELLSKSEEEKKIEVASAWKRYDDSWRSEDDFEEEKGKKKKKILGFFSKKDKKGKK